MARGVLLAQLGTPDAPTPKALRRFLKEFLLDRRVVDYPRWFWLPILYGPILTFRPRKSAALYRKIWTPEGSPLLLTTRRQAQLLQDALGDSFVVEIGMRYGKPSIAHGIDRLLSMGVEQIVVLPLFPQYSHTTTGSVFDAVDAALNEHTDAPPLRRIRSFATAPSYIDALAARAREYQDAKGEPDRWMLSYHGIPERYARHGDPYPAECQATSRALAKTMGWEEDRWEMCYQSRFGPEAWLAPYTDARLEDLGKAGLRRLAVSCPGFVADCLETLDEIGEVGAGRFAKAGGGQLELLPCLNDHPAAIDMLAALTRQASGEAGWEAEAGLDVLS